MAEDNKVNVRLTGTQLKKLKAEVKNNTGTTLRINLKILMEIIYHMSYYWQQD